MFAHERLLWWIKVSLFAALSCTCVRLDEILLMDFEKGGGTVKRAKNILRGEGRFCCPRVDVRDFI